MLEKFFKDILFLLDKKKISGAGDGEKALLTFLNGSSIFLSDNFASAGKIKRALTMIGKNVEIISSAVDKSEGESNMRPFVEGACKFLNGQLDYLIFLPCSAIVKFDLKAIKAFEISKNSTFDLTKLCQTLSQIRLSKRRFGFR